jgi:hypothetical protein
VGARLFVPGASRADADELGEQLAERAARHDDDIAETRQWLASREATPRGRLRLSVPAEFAMLVLARALRASCALPPGGAGGGHHAATRRPVQRALRPGVRMGRWTSPTWSPGRYMVLERGLYASPIYLQTHGAPLTPDDLARHEFVLLTQALGMQWTLQNGRRQAPLHMRARWSATPSA